MLRHGNLFSVAPKTDRDTSACYMVDLVVKEVVYQTPASVQGASPVIRVVEMANDTTAPPTIRVAESLTTDELAKVSERFVYYAHDTSVNTTLHRVNGDDVFWSMTCNTLSEQLDSVRARLCTGNHNAPTRQKMHLEQGTLFTVTPAYAMLHGIDPDTTFMVDCAVSLVTFEKVVEYRGVTLRLKKEVETSAENEAPTDVTVDAVEMSVLLNLEIGKAFPSRDLCGPDREADELIHDTVFAKTGERLVYYAHDIRYEGFWCILESEVASSKTTGLSDGLRSVRAILHTA